MLNKNKVQSLLVKHLLEHGQIELKLPDGVILEIGMTQEDKKGNLVVKDDYCWIIASHKNRSTSLDPYNMGLRFKENEKTLILDDKFTDQDGIEIRRLDVI